MLSVKINKLSILLLILLLFSFPVHSQKKSSKDKPEPDPSLSQKDNDYIERQDHVFLDTISSILTKYPPSAHEGPARSHAKLLLDAVCHDQYAAFRTPVQEFFHSRVDKVIDELEKTKVTAGAVIWKIYNMGFILRTKTVTVAFDLVSGITSDSKDFAFTSSEADRLVKQCDILFISHRHADHAEKNIASRFLDLGLPVVAPSQVWKDDKIGLKLTRLERDPMKVQRLELRNGKKLEVIVCPGHQMKDVDVNVVLVTTQEGITAAHLGDQINEGEFMIDFAWIDKVSTIRKVDIMMPNCWTNDIDRIAKGFNPAVILPGHELELGHSIWDRVPFWGDNEYLGTKFIELRRKYPVVALVWGESYLYKQSIGR